MIRVRPGRHRRARQVRADALNGTGGNLAGRRQSSRIAANSTPIKTTITPIVQRC